MSSFKKRLFVYFGIGGVVLIALALIILFLSSRSGQVKSAKTADVSLPTIYKGELLLPKVTGETQNNFNKTAVSDRLAVISANLAAVVENNQVTGIRIIGEVGNASDRDVTGVSAVVRFYNNDGNLAGQKVAKTSLGFDFKTVAASGNSLYDITVDSPPASERLEVLFNVTSSTTSAIYKPLLISNRKLETKTTTINNSTENSSPQTSTDSAQASSSAQEVATPQQKVDYYMASGQIVNPLSNPVTDITIYAWAKDETNRVFALGRTDFKNDLLNPGEKIDFKTMLLPIRQGQEYSAYEISAWGKEFKLLN